MPKRKTAINNNRKTFVYRRPEDLTAHRLQNVVIRDNDDGNYELLKENVRRDGITELIEITTGNVILDGHRRRRVATELGIEKLRCWVRHDLKTQEAINRRFLEANLVRRQMSPLAQTRVLRVLAPEEEARLEMARQLFGDVSEVTLKRREAVLDTPEEVQKAVESEKVRLVDAVRVKHQTAKTKKRIAKLISEGHDPREVIKQHTKKLRQPSKEALLKKAVKRFVSGLKAGVADLAGDQKATRDQLTPDQRAVLGQSQQLIEQLLGPDTGDGNLECT